MKLPIMREIGRVPVDCLLEIADHREMAGSRRRLSILQPLAARFEGTRDLDEHEKLLRVGVLCFVEEDTIILFANSLREVWPLQQLHRERDLISISNRAASETELAVIPLHFCCDARRTCACPFSQRPKS